ncbi:MAG: hypothetical protein GEV11_20220 [Streptosporangiales bacterium]|nr:hypothetical protein [Streptosporangiales bacterium]
MRIKLVAAVLAALAGGVLGGCTASADVPDGFTAGKAANVTFAHPEGWSTTSTGSTYQAELRKGGRLGAVLTAQRIDVQSGDARAALATAIGGPQLSWFGYSVQGMRDLEIEGAESSARVDYTYRDNREQGIAVGPGAGTDVAVVVPGRKVDLVRITWSRGALTAAQVNEIVSTIRYQEG